MDTYPKELIQNQICRLFEQSQMYILFAFLNTPAGRQVMKIHPSQDTQNPKTIYFSSVQLRKACPRLATCRYELTAVLERSGMTIKSLSSKTIIDKFYYAMSHPNLCLKSSKAELLEVWKNAQIHFFLKNNCILARIFKALSAGGDQFIQWNKQGNAITISPRWPGHSIYLQKSLKRSGFQTISFPEVSHPYVRRQYPIDPWFMIHMKRKRILKDRLIRKNMKKKELQLEQKQHPKPIQNSILKQTEDKLFQKLMSKQPPVPKKPKVKITEFLNCIKQTVIFKILELKPILAKLQSQNMEMQLSHIFLLLDQVKQISEIVEKQPYRPAQKNIPLESGDINIEQILKTMQAMKQRIDKLQNQNSYLKMSFNVAQRTL